MGDGPKKHYCMPGEHEYKSVETHRFEEDLGRKMWAEYMLYCVGCGHVKKLQEDQ